MQHKEKNQIFLKSYTIFEVNLGSIQVFFFSLGDLLCATKRETLNKTVKHAR